jgi:hypothetical protein
LLILNTKYEVLDVQSFEEYGSIYCGLLTEDQQKLVLGIGNFLCFFDLENPCKPKIAYSKKLHTDISSVLQIGKN